MRACMRRPFREALASTPVVLEIVPPGRRVSEKAVNTFVERVRDSVRSLKNLDAVNIPEVLEENHAGQPFYRDLDPRDFAALLGDLGVDPIVNKVVAHVPSESVLRRWIQESLERHGLRNFVLVGGNSSRVRYPGPCVAGRGAHAVVAPPRSRRAIASRGAARREHRGGLGPQLRPRGADGPRVPLVARGRGVSCDSGPRTGRPRSETQARYVIMQPLR